MANKIQIDIAANDQASAAIKQTTASVDSLSLAIGTGLGYGLHGVIRELTQSLIQLAKVPYDAATQFAELARKGKETSEVFKELARAQDQAREAWNNYRRDIGEGVAKEMTMWETISARIAVNLKQGFFRGYSYGTFDLADAARAAAGTSDIHDAYGGGRALTLAQQRGIEESVKREAEATIKIQEARAKEAENFRRMIAGVSSIVTPDFRLPQRMTPRQQFQAFYGTGQLMTPIPLQGLEQTTRSYTDAAVQAGAQVASGLAEVAAQFVTGMTTLGQALRSFFVTTVSSILAEMGKIGIGNFLKSLAGAGAGGFLGFLGKVGGGLLGLRAGGARGSTVVFQGLNTRDMYMAVATRQGGLFRANDLMALRAGA